MERYREAKKPSCFPRGSFPLLSFLRKAVIMNLFELIRALIDIESITNNERNVERFLYDYLSALAARFSGQIERMEAGPERCNLFVHWGTPVVTLSTHMDTVPPFLASNEDDEFIWGRGACDAKGIIGAMVFAAHKLLEARVRNFGLLLLVGEERNSTGARAANQSPRGSRYLINGEPTENQLAVASKGALRLEVTAHGKMAHSAYPELGDSAIDRLLDVLHDIRGIPLPEDSLLGRCTLNIGTISGGCAPNVVADSAHAEIMFRLVGDPAPLRESIAAALAGRASASEVLCTPAMRFEGFDGIPKTIVSYTTDIPVLAGAWGKPFLLGPGSIHVAHTAEERVPKSQLEQAVDIYSRMVRGLLANA
jgi:acetylornithine deacetylase